MYLYVSAHTIFATQPTETLRIFSRGASGRAGTCRRMYRTPAGHTMAPRIHNQQLETRTQRLKLKPYPALIARQLSVAQFTVQSDQSIL